MRILLVGSEALPFAKTGGLADVLGALPAALRDVGHDASLLMPLYPQVDRGLLAPTERRVRVEVGTMNVELRVWRALQGDALFLENDHLFGTRDFYGGAEHELASRWIAFGRAVVEILRDPPDGRPFDVLHANDWQTGLVPAWLRTRDSSDPHLARVATVFTIHNLAYQGCFSVDLFPLLGIDWRHFNLRELEFWNTVSFLKAGLVYADEITTVSEKYAREILTPEAGNALDGVLRDRAADLHGVLNGIDTAAWDPETDRLIPARYSARNPRPRDLCRSALMREAGLPRADEVPLAGMITRFASQKGLELVLDRMDAVLARVRLVVLGSGESRYEARLRDAARARPDRLSVTVGYDESFAHRIEAGSDLFFMPSLYEPCGLNQMYSLRYGAVPVVRATGGLDDTVIDADAEPARGNGFKFEAFDPDAFVAALDRALAARRDAARWAAIRARGMASDFSWDSAARKYAAIYERATEKSARRAAA
ncbi:MAG TPA: glycogen synthase GlgA [bacterium]|nr:glycogen synthase GlgA [bacterium]